MIDNIRPGELRPYGKNSRTHSTEQITQIAKSIKKFGFTNPVLTDGSYGIIAGHGRVLAAIELGMETVPTLSLDHLSKKQQRAYIIADNKLALNAGWDEGILKEEMQGILESGIDLDLTGFSLDEIDDLLGKESEPGEKDDEVPEVEENIHNVKLGDLWKLGEHRLLCGDSTDKDQVDRLMAGVKADMVFTDPPYGIGESNSDFKSRGKIAKAIIYRKSDWDNFIPDEKAFVNIFEFSKDQIIFGGNYFIEYLTPGPGWIVWDKNQTGDFADCELAWTSLRKAVRKYEQTWNGMIRQGETGKRVHPTQKPIALSEWCFENYGDPKTVLDLFLGSGSTLIACEKTNRKCYGMEIDPHYCSVIIERWQKFTESKAELCDG